MDKTGACSNSRNTVRTDLSLLLECLKFQMKCPDLQKQALLTIHSICESREDNVDLLREMGGVAFVYNLSKSSIVRSDVKETALFTLGTLAEANVYCKNSLCRKETFEDLADMMIKEDIPVTQKRVSVYLLSVLVANNKSGQTLSQTTGCLDILLDLFRTTSPLCTEASLRAANATQTYQLWASVSSALCGCVNNPQNEDGQRICVSAFPIIKVWLQQIDMPRTEIFQPICSFIAMTVANNSCVQESFSASGGLDTLTLSLVRLASAAGTSFLSCQLSVTISKTLSACITENCEYHSQKHIYIYVNGSLRQIKSVSVSINSLFFLASLASGLAQYGVVSHLFSLLVSPHLDPEDRLSVLLTLGHCTETSEEHQSQLVQCGGLPLIITLLTEDTSEEVRKAATFILQTCKKATMSLGVPGLMARQREGDNMEPLINMEGFRSSARELLRRIDLLERKQAKEAEDEQEDTDLLTLTEGLGMPSLPAASPLPLQQESMKTIPTEYRQNNTVKHVETRDGNNNKLQTVRNVIKKKSDNKLKTSGGSVCCSVCKGTGFLMPPNLRPLEGAREPHTEDNQLFMPPAPVRHSVPTEMKCTDEEDLQDSEMTKEEHSVSTIRCTGCVLPFEEVTSRNFESLQGSCQHSCDMHRVLQEATERFRTRRCNLLFGREYQGNAVEHTDPDSEGVLAAEPQRSRENWREVSLTPIRKGAGRGCLPEHHWKKHNGITLTPMRRGAKNETVTERRGGNNSGNRVLDDEPRAGADHCSTKRKRNDFSREEVNYLLSGVNTYGLSWNSILWSYPFQPGRTNVDLAKKYRRLMKGKAQDSGCE
ncbi:telomere repeats-binding bouquet formation protein 1 isoform X2 [Epinephelus fuscoguttatus]|uniref:telomere repeats-binding bouquet formation protein 1 isoform X2 n=1 Tax=Epinephelus fuscoguttatus TaxID=293821 RepID=UPI0020D1A343|nr:telomere repeats-binding bouquet formation protein 1 isoform X2 [Epinephelus fuscoguttatus]